MKRMMIRLRCQMMIRSLIAGQVKEILGTSRCLFEGEARWRYYHHHHRRRRRHYQDYHHCNHLHHTIVIDLNLLLIIIR